jgi:hypothetical protein
VAVIRFSAAFAVLVIGIVVSVVGDSSTVWFVVGLALVGFGAVALMSLLFYEVGRSEDRERERSR